MKNFRKIFGLAIMAILCSCSGNYKPPVPAALVNFQPTLKVQQQWAKNLTSGVSGQALKLSPALDNGKIFVSSYAGNVVAVDIKNGKTLWAINTKLNLTSGLAAESGMIFGGSEDGKIMAWQQQNGAIVWSNTLGGTIIATPTTTTNVVIVKAKNGQLSAFDIHDGKQLWTYMHEEPGLVLSGDSSSKIVNNMVVTGFASGELVILNLSDGSLIWRELVAEGHGSFPAERMVDIDADPQIVGGIVYIVTYQGRIAAIELKTGHIVWDHEISSVSGLAVDNSRVYVADDKGVVWSFNRNTGALMWKQEALLNRGITAPALLDNAVVVGDAQGYVHFMAKDDGHFVARSNVGNGRLTKLITG